jgi:Transglutaminase-like superfamily
MVFNHAPVDPVVIGNTYTWELRNLPYIRNEQQGPTVPNLVPRISYRYIAPSASAPLRSYTRWSDVSRWLTDLHEPQVIVDDAVAAKARELTADAKTELEKIQAIGRFVQNIQYISIDIGVGRGNGMKPHASTQVLSKAYGDCKDKANLMRAMLRALRITAYPVVIYSGDRTYVREQWASPLQFNHCIIAIKVSDETIAPTVIEHADLGRLLIFDPTDDITPVGDLPDHEQGSWALVIAGEKGSLTRMPVTPPESNQMMRTAQIELQSDGSIKAFVKESSMGQAAAWERGLFRKITRPQYNQIIEGWITQGATGAKVAKVEPSDAMKAGTFDLNVEFTAAGYGQLMQDRLLVFKPAIVSRSGGISSSDEKRTQPVVLKSRSYQETVRVKLPADFEVDELPDPLKLESAFGSYNATFEVVDGQLVFKRSLIQKAATIPVEQYRAVKNFYGQILGLEQSPVVLVRK